MKLKAIPVVTLVGALLGGCAVAPVAETGAEVSMEKRIITGSRIAQEVPADGSGNLHTRTGAKTYTAHDLDATGGAIRSLSPMIW